MRTSAVPGHKRKETTCMSQPFPLVFHLSARQLLPFSYVVLSLAADEWFGGSGGQQMGAWVRAEELPDWLLKNTSEYLCERV